MHWGEALAVALVAACGVLLLAAANAWRRAINESPGLPIWRFLRREGITRDDAADTLSGHTMMQAELRCAVCGNGEECRARLTAGGAAAPPVNCPNARLFDDFGVRVDHTRA